MRKYALIWSIPLIITAAGIIVELRAHNKIHYENIVKLWPVFTLSGILFLITLYFIWKKQNYGMSVVLLILQFAFAFFAYGFSHYPYLLYPHLTIHEGFTTQEMAIALVIVFILGLCLLIPSLYLLFRLFLFNKEYVTGERKDHA